MGQLNYECPHCGAHTAAFHIISAYAFQRDERVAAVALRCGSCDNPASALLRSVYGINTPISQFTKDHTNPILHEWEVVNFFPAPKVPDIPEHLPEQVRRPLLGAERARHIEPYETSCSMYGKALDVALSTIPEAEGSTLYERIESMGKNGELPRSLVEVLHNLRIIRNGAAHDPNPFTKQEMEEFGEATKLVLTYLFTLPGRVAALKAGRKG